MKFLEISLEVDGESAEAVASLFSRFGQGGAVTETRPDSPKATVKVYIPQGEDGRMQELQEALWHLGQIRPLPAPQIRELGEEDWAQAWKVHYRLQRIGKITILPTWQKLPAVRDGVIRLDPGMAFGTGLHPTTRLSLLALQNHLRPGDKVLDMGTGSGILAIASAKLGAKLVLALDLDPVAVRVAQENVEANRQARRVRVQEGSLHSLAQEATFDLILVNIFADTIRQMLESGLVDHLKPRGWIIASGIVHGQEKELIALLKERGCRRIQERKRGYWLTLIAQKA